MMLVSVPPQNFASFCCGMIDREPYGRVKGVTSQHFSVLCEYAINDVSVSHRKFVCLVSGITDGRELNCTKG